MMREGGGNCREKFDPLVVAEPARTPYFMFCHRRFFEKTPIAKNEDARGFPRHV